MDFFAQGRVEQQKIFMIVIIGEFLFHLRVMMDEKLRNVANAQGDETKIFLHVHKFSSFNLKRNYLN